MGTPVTPIPDVIEKRILLIRGQRVMLDAHLAELYMVETKALKRGAHSKFLPFVFTEQGVTMLSSVLKSTRAIQVNIEIMRAFVRLREIIAAQKDLARKLDDLEKRYDQKFRVVFDAIRQMTAPTGPPSRRRIGFGVEEPHI
ncbi:MAG TPA: ORF6N domain-containing protein [Bacteroidota bacterium]|nr:ORF6N domain-containing protein [Bacteroidota bacterium]